MSIPCDVSVTYTGKMYKDDHGKEYPCDMNAKYFVRNDEGYRKYACGKHLSKAVDGALLAAVIVVRVG